MKAARTRRDKGIAIITTTLTMITTMMMAGLGFDVGILYLVRTKLQGAADAAATTAVRSLALNGDMTAAQTIGQEFLAANFVNGYWNSTTLGTNGVTVTLIDQNGNAGAAGTTAVAKLVTVTAGVTAPLYFLRILGQNTVTINIVAQAKREGLLIMLLLDGSQSMTAATFNGGTTACQIALGDAQAFLAYSQWDPDIDRIGLVTFASNAFVAAPIANFQLANGAVNTSSTVYTALSGFQCNGNTNTEEGLQQTYLAIQNFYGGAGVKPNRANLVVLMTDGAPNGVLANWNTMIKSGSGCSANSANPTMLGYASGTGNPPSRVVRGVFDVRPLASSANMQATGTIANNGCHMQSSNQYFDQDFTQYPATSAYGDAFTGSGTYLPSTLLTFYEASPPLNSANDDAQVRALSSNAADGAAKRMRTDSTPLRITFFVIGLDGNAENTYDTIDPVLLKRIANVPASTSYDPSQPVGGYYQPQDATVLGQAFTDAATEISARLSK